MCLTDGECMERCLEGDGNEYAHLVRRYEHLVRYHLEGILADSTEVAEATQETFVRAFFALAKLKKRESFFSWLLSIASAAAADQQRAAHRHRRSIEAASRRMEARETNKSHGVDHALREKIARLPEHYREVILLRYYAGLSCKEVAARLDKPLGTVTKMLSRAHAMLREASGGARMPADADADDREVES